VGALIAGELRRLARKNFNI